MTFSAVPNLIIGTWSSAVPELSRPLHSDAVCLPVVGEYVGTMHAHVGAMDKLTAGIGSKSTTWSVVSNLFVLISMAHPEQQSSQEG